MRSKIAQRILDETPKEVRIFVRKYGDIVVRINQLIREKGYTQKQLAYEMKKTPSEISKWLSGDHNFTLRSIAKLEAILGESILQASVPLLKPEVFILSLQSGESQNFMVVRGQRPFSGKTKIYQAQSETSFSISELVEQYN